MDKETMSHIFLIYLLVINIITFLAYLIDKKKAVNGSWRTKEITLILLGFLGGAFGATLGMKLVRHKTKHIKFLILVPLSLILWLYIIYYMSSNVLK